MVIKLQDVEMAESEIHRTTKTKRPVEPVDPSDEVVQPKKLKTAVEERIEKDLLLCEDILKTGSKNLNLKLQTLTEFFESLLFHNVNTVTIKDDFPSWVKDAITNVISCVEEVSVEFFNFLTSALKVAPTSFEPISEKVLTICVFHPRKDDAVQLAYDEFMNYLVNMFERLRRFPKLIAKFLCCARDFFFDDKNKDVFEQRKFVVDVLLPTKFMESIGPVVNLLPSGQVVDLWKMLHHNLEVECVQRISNNSDDKQTHRFLSIVTSLFMEFLSNAKVADFSVPGSTVEKAAEMMVKLRDDCLQKLGMAILGRDHESELVKSFLKLSYTWGELHGVLLHFSPRYTVHQPIFEYDSTEPIDLSFLHPYLKCTSWIELGKRIIRGNDPSVTTILVSLVAQKLKYMTALEQKNNGLDTSLVSVNQDKEKCVKEDTKTHQRLKDERLKAAAEFIWTYQNSVDLPDLDETLNLVAQYVDSQKMIELAGNFVKQLQSSSQKGLNVSSGVDDMLKGGSSNFIIASGNQRFHYALVLEALGEVMRRIGKMKLLSKPIKAILNDTLSVQNRADLLVHAEIAEKEINDKQKDIISSLRSAVNSMIVDKTGDENQESSCKKIGEEFSSELIDGMLKFLCNLELENYPKNVKVLVFLCSVVILLALVEQNTDDDILNSVAKIVADCGSHSHGNEILFSVKWINLYKWFSSNVNRFSVDVQKDLCEMILANVYVSPKLVSEYEEKEFNILCESFELTAPLGHVALITLEFLIKELQGTKSKLTPQLQNHTRKLSRFVVTKLEETEVSVTSHKKLKKRMSSNASSIESNVYRSCWLSRKALQILNENDLPVFKAMLPDKIQSALKFLKSCKSIEDVSSDVQISISYALKFLHSVCKSKEELKADLPEDFLMKLWKSCSDQRMWRWDSLRNSRSSEPVLPKRLLKDLYEAADANEFEGICLSIIALTKEESNLDEHNDNNIKMIIHLLDELIEAELAVGKKQFRRKAIEECLHDMLGLTLMWTSDNASLQEIVLPYIKFQTKLLRRRNAMVNLTALAVCLTSVTSVPMNKIEDLKIYRKVFCTVADLVNAFAVHRLDVLSFRTHVYLQCFQFLIESLAKKADQRNKLTDGEIFDLRHCAHSIERICQSVKLGQKEFSRVSPYFVAVLMRQFEIFTVYPAVKAPLLNGTYKLLDLCDEHGIAQLNSMLTIGSREVFKTVYELYKKYYQYKGKV